MSDVIKFGSGTDNFSEFVNSAIFSIRIDGLQWLSVHHFVQAIQFEDVSFREMIRKADTVEKVDLLVSDSYSLKREDWEDKKISMMYIALRCKFEQHPRLRNLLLSTGNSVLIFNDAEDDFWGSGKNDDGENMLGNMLMEIRSEIIHKQKQNRYVSV